MSHKPTNDTRSRPMTAETIHTCSYSCERPGCIRAQRDELVARLAAAPSGDAAGDWVLVPRTPTDAMLRAAQSAWLNDTLRRTTTMWRAMLEAAPQQTAAVDEAAFDANFLRSIASLCRAAYDLCDPKPQRTPEDPREHYGELCLLELKDIADEIERRLAAVDGAKETDLWRCTVCGRVGAVGRCCGEETRERYLATQHQEPDWDAAPPGATHYQPHQDAYYKRVSATEWYVWSREDGRELLQWLLSPGTSDSAEWVVRPAEQPAEPVKRKRRYAQGTALGEFGILPMCDQVDDETVKVPSYDLAHEIWAAAQTAPGEGIEDAVIRIARATAPLQAEVEALRKEVEEWRSFAEAQVELRDEAEDHAEELAKALAGLITWFPSADTYRRLGFDPEAPMRSLKRAKLSLGGGGLSDD